MSVAFLLTAALALSLLGVFVTLRVADALDDRTRELLGAQAEGLAGTSPADRATTVAELTGDLHVQLFDAAGDTVASSPLVAGPLVTPADLAAAMGNGAWYGNRVVAVLDDDAAATGDRHVEHERAAVLAVRADEQVIAVATSQEDMDEALAAVRTQLLVGLPLALVVAGVLGYVVAGAGLRPVEFVRRRAERISDRSSGERLPLPPADDELRRLVVTLNAMLDRLDDGLRRERRFVADASHELRTPLALVRTEVDLALARPRSIEELTAALSSVREETVRLTALTENLLTLAAADEKRLVRSREPVDLRTVADLVRDRFAPTTDRPLTTTGDQHATVHGDRERLGQVVTNLVDNALRHGTGSVTIDVRADLEGVRLAVIDHGIGFTVKDPFARFVGSQTGLGLAIARDIVTAHGGTVHASHQDGSTTVTVTLPPATTAAGNQPTRA